MENTIRNAARQHLKEALGESAIFRHGQLEAIESALDGQRSLLVQQTGWGKSIVYFIASLLLRKQGSGPTIVISPLIALMRDQIRASKDLGLNSVSINSSNSKNYNDELLAAIERDEVDLILLSPEQIGNASRFNALMASIGARGVGLLVVDEAHCISDWGHDFRPDYRRIVSLIHKLPSKTPILATTATANDRVVKDIVSQLGDIKVFRGPLIRKSLSLQAFRLDTQEERLAWLAKNIPLIEGSGLVYCLTINDCEKVATWLQACGIDAKEYHSRIPSDERSQLEDEFQANKFKVMVSTVALGMGYDKSDIAFVIHFQGPQNIVSYYQQIGRAGRQIDQAYAILLSGQEDELIQEFFIESAFPTEEEVALIVNYLSQVKSSTRTKMLAELNLPFGLIGKALLYLDVEGIVSKQGSSYSLLDANWTPSLERSQKITALRYEEMAEMKSFIDLKSCYMEYISQALDDPFVEQCGRCFNCLKESFFKEELTQNDILTAIDFMNDQKYQIKPRKRWPSGLKSRTVIDLENEAGIYLAKLNDAGYGKLLRASLENDRPLHPDLIKESAKRIKEWLGDDVHNKLLAYVPSNALPDLMHDFAHDLADGLGLELVKLLHKKEGSFKQGLMENSYYQCKNALEAYCVLPSQLPNKDILLVDNLIDSGWTLSVCGNLLREAGAGRVYPFALGASRRRA